MTNNHLSEGVGDPFFTDSERSERASQALWAGLATLFQARWLIILVTGAAAVLAVVISLMLPNWYRAETRLLLPASSGSSLLSGVLGNIPSSARSLLGGITGDYLRHLSILDSRTVKEKVIRRFDLIKVYEIEEADSAAAMQAALEILSGNMELLVDDEFNHLTVQVYDQDPKRAANMANYFVEELDQVNGQLNSQSARSFRIYVEERYEETEADLDSVMSAMRDLQKRYGILDIETQGEIFFTGVTELRLQALQAEIEFESLLSELGPDNAIVQAARTAAQSANRKYEAAMEGRERMLPVPKEDLPDVGLAMADLKLEAVVLGKMMEYTRPVLEQARMDELRKVESVQVVDPAEPPVKKARPFRALIVIASMVSAFLLVSIYVLLSAWWRRNHKALVQRLQAAGSKETQETDSFAQPTVAP